MRALSAHLGAAGHAGAAHGLQLRPGRQGATTRGTRRDLERTQELLRGLRLSLRGEFRSSIFCRQAGEVIRCLE